jgi:hypothetical protein
MATSSICSRRSPKKPSRSSAANRERGALTPPGRTTTRTRPARRDARHPRLSRTTRPPRLVAPFTNKQNSCPVRVARIPLLLPAGWGCGPCFRCATSISPDAGRRETGPAPRGAQGTRWHTFASTLVAIGRDPTYVMQQLGHTDPAFTLRVYAHTMRRSEEERERLKALVQGHAWAANGQREPAPDQPTHRATDS